jgi:poly-gamma-glutamate synthesis protein (capsule biosynthesis protein)
MYKKAIVCVIAVLLIAGCGQPVIDGTDVSSPVEEPAREVMSQPEPSRLNLTAVGDIMLSRVVGSRMNSNSVYHPYDATRHITTAADITFGNLETTLATTGTRLPGKVIWFRAVPEATEGLTDAGFDVLSLANNHILDYDTPALLETIQNLEAAGIGFVGAGENLEQARRPLVVVKNSIRVGFLAYNEFYHYYWSTSYKRTFEATEDIAGTAPMKEELIKEDIEKLKELCDVVVVSLHWGIEESNRITAAQQNLAHKIVDWGGDIILGHHPHVLQGIEFYKGKPIAYSLGNFIFDQNDQNNNQSIILSIVIQDNQIVETTAYPIYIYDKCQPRIPEDSKKEYIIDKIARLSEALGTSVHREEERAVFGGI